LEVDGKTLKKLARLHIKVSVIKAEEGDPDALAWKAWLAENDPEKYKRLFPTPEEKQRRMDQLAVSNPEMHRCIMEYRAKRDALR
jgi:hypothetical protein